MIFPRKMRRFSIFSAIVGRRVNCLLREPFKKLLEHLREPGRFEAISKVAQSEPPRVRAMLGAIGQQLEQETRLQALRRNLNTLSRFDFGCLAVLKHAREWQAKERKQ